MHSLVFDQACARRLYVVRFTAADYTICTIWDQTFFLYGATGLV
jgi:hypothetical protein